MLDLVHRVAAMRQRAAAAPKTLAKGKRGSVDLRPIAHGAVQLLQPTTDAGKRVGPAMFGTPQANRSPGKLAATLRRSGRFSEQNVGRMVDQARAMRGPVGEVAAPVALNYTVGRGRGYVASDQSKVNRPRTPKRDRLSHDVTKLWRTGRIVLG